MKFILAVLLFLIPLSAEAKTHTISVSSDVITSDVKTIDELKTEAQVNAQTKASEQVGVYVEASTKVVNLAFDDELITTTTASVQRIIKKTYSVFTDENGNNVICHMTIEFDDETIQKALDKAQVTAERNYYKTSNAMNEQTASKFKEQSINPTSYDDTDLKNLYKQAKNAYNTEDYPHAIQYLNQVLMTAGANDNIYKSSLELLCVSYAYIGEFDKSFAISNRLLEIEQNNYYGLYAQLYSYFWNVDDVNYKSNLYKAVDVAVKIAEHAHNPEKIRPFMNLSTYSNPTYTLKQFGEYTMIGSLAMSMTNQPQRAYYFASDRKFPYDSPVENSKFLMIGYGEKYETYIQAYGYGYIGQNAALNMMNKDSEMHYTVDIPHPFGHFIYAHNSSYPMAKRKQYVLDGMEECKKHPLRWDYRITYEYLQKMWEKLQ